MMQGRQNMPLMSGQPQYSWIEINISGSLSQSRWALFLLALFVSVFALVVLLAVYNARKLSEYRERERTSFHLVQLGEAARTLAHEIKNPLGVIRLQCATLRRTVPEDRLRNIDTIEEETARLAGLSDRIREFLDNSDGTPELVHTGAILNRLRERYGDRLSVAESSGGNLLVYIDPDRLMQILDNLVSNAFDAGGSEPPMLGLETSRSLLLFTVSDSGPGVAPEHRSRLFELFFTTKTKGSGIGLALAAKYAKQAGGAIAYAPRTGGGSIFTLSLPASGGKK
jgi:two-component system sensor histidine kinase HydH